MEDLRNDEEPKQDGKQVAQPVSQSVLRMPGPAENAQQDRPHKGIGDVSKKERIIAPEPCVKAPPSEKTLQRQPEANEPAAQHELPIYHSSSSYDTIPRVPRNPGNHIPRILGQAVNSLPREWRWERWGNRVVRVQQKTWHGVTS